MAWASWSEALAQRSAPSASTSISPAPSARNSCLAPSLTCCRVGARPRSGSREPRAPMLLASSEGSIGMAAPAFLVPELVRRSAGQGASAQNVERPTRPSPADRSSGARSGPRAATVQVADEANTDNVASLYACRPLAKPMGRQPGGLGIWSRGYPGDGSLGQDRHDRARRGGQGGPNPVSLHPRPRLPLPQHPRAITGNHLVAPAEPQPSDYEPDARRRPGRLQPDLIRKSTVSGQAGAPGSATRSRVQAGGWVRRSGGGLQ